MLSGHAWAPARTVGIDDAPDLLDSRLDTGFILDVSKPDDCEITALRAPGLDEVSPDHNLFWVGRFIRVSAGAEANCLKPVTWPARRRKSSRRSPFVPCRFGRWDSS